MAGKKVAAPVDTSLGQKAYALALAHRADLDPRLPSGTIDTLGADLTTLGAGPAAAPPPAATPTPSLPDAVAKAESLVSAVHTAVLESKAKPAVRKAYGASSKSAGVDAKRVLAAAQKIITAASADASGALALGILPADVTALGQAEQVLQAALAAAGPSGKTGPSATLKRAAATRMHAAIARIAGAGVLAFAQNASIRADFEALRVKKKT